MKTVAKLGLVAAVGVGAACASTSASAGQWRLDPARCPDLVEDRLDRLESRRDERVDRGPRDRAEDRRDRRESRRDERVTVCPASAWVWDGPAKRRAARPGRVTVYYDAPARRYYRYGPRRSRVTVVVR